MAVSNRFIVEQTPVIAAFGRLALSALMSAKGSPPALPGPELSVTVPPRSAALLAAYARHVGADAAAYRRFVPPHLFPQWSFPLVTKALSGIGYRLERVVNAGCRLEMRRPIPADEALDVRVRLESLDDNGRRVLIATRVVSGSASAPEALAATLYALIPLGGGKRESGAAPPKERKEPVRVPDLARELAFWRIGADAGLDFAKLTGDFNPIHWVPAYARALGHRGCILHGFSLIARAMEGITRARFTGDATRLKVFDASLVSPLLLPARVGLYLDSGSDGDRLFVGDAPGGRAYLTARVEHATAWSKT
jgi:acyl dehydratase